MSKTSFERELAEVINRHSMENGSDTPDFLLAEYLLSCIESYNRAVRCRERWYGRKAKEEEGPCPTSQSQLG